MNYKTLLITRCCRMYFEPINYYVIYLYNLCTERQFVIVCVIYVLTK